MAERYRVRRSREAATLVVAPEAKAVDCGKTRIAAGLVAAWAVDLARRPTLESLQVLGGKGEC